MRRFVAGAVVGWVIYAGVGWVITRRITEQIRTEGERFRASIDQQLGVANDG